MSLRWKEVYPCVDEPDFKIWMATYKQVRIEKYVNGTYHTIDNRFSSIQACMDRVNRFWDEQGRKPGR